VDFLRALRFFPPLLCSLFLLREGELLLSLWEERKSSSGERDVTFKTARRERTSVSEKNTSLFRTRESEGEKFTKEKEGGNEKLRASLLSCRFDQVLV
jgi:hypothetical protein